MITHCLSANRSACRSFKHPLCSSLSISNKHACRDLNALFEELVRQSGSISEQEFWAGRQHLLRKQQGESGAQKQRAGLGNAMLLAVRPSADGKTNTVCTLLCWLQDNSTLHPHICLCHVMTRLVMCRHSIDVTAFTSGHAY